MHVSNFENECRKKSNRKKSHGKKVTDLDRKKVTGKNVTKRIMLFFNFWLGKHFYFYYYHYYHLIFCLE